MPGNITMQLHGFEETNRKLAAIGARAGKAAMRRVGRKALEPVRDDARRLAPRETGGLADSIVISTTLTPRQRRMARRETRDTVTVYVGTAHKAAVPQEFGTIAMRANTFLRPAWESNKDGVLAFIIRELDRELVKTADRATARAARLAETEAAE